MVEQQLSATPAGRARPRAAGKRLEPMPANPALALWSTAVGKKVVMAVTGVILVGFVIAHMLGNLKIFLGQEAID